MMNVILISKQKRDGANNLLRLFFMFLQIPCIRADIRTESDFFAFLHPKSPAAVFKDRETRSCIRESGDLQIVVADHKIYMDD